MQVTEEPKQGLSLVHGLHEAPCLEKLRTVFSLSKTIVTKSMSMSSQRAPCGFVRFLRNLSAFTGSPG